MIRISHENNARVLLAGMKALPNYGKDYVEKFESVYPELAKKDAVITELQSHNLNTGRIPVTGVLQ